MAILMNRDYLTVRHAARLAGMTKKGIYWLIKNKNIPFEEELSDGYKLTYKIPSHDFLSWLEDYKSWYVEKANTLQRNQQELKNFLNL